MSITMDYLRQLSCYKSRVEQLQQGPRGFESLKCLLLGFLLNKSANPCSSVCLCVAEVVDKEIGNTVR